jgi:hypothetical protein
LEDNWFNELGPMRIPRSHKLVQEIVNQFNLDLEPFNNDAHTLYIENQTLSMDEYINGSPLVTI